MTSISLAGIPQMVDVDGHIEEQLLRWGEGVTVRPMFQEIPLDDFEWAWRDAYDYRAADEYQPQPPSALEGWERDLHGLAPIPIAPSFLGCRCPLCVGSGFNPSPFRARMSEMSRVLDRAFNQMVTRFVFDESSLLGLWTEPQPRMQPVTCPDITPAETITRVSEWALAPALTITPERFTPVLRRRGFAKRIAEQRAFWDRPQPRRIR